MNKYVTEEEVREVITKLRESACIEQPCVDSCPCMLNQRTADMLENILAELIDLRASWESEMSKLT